MKSVNSLKWLSIALSLGSLVSAIFRGVTANDLFVTLFLSGVICGCAFDIIKAIERAFHDHSDRRDMGGET